MIATVGESVLHLGDCRAVMFGFNSESIDAVVTDPPYGFKFMGKGWDHGVPGVEFWAEALRVLKPGGHLLAFGGPRTFHRLTCGIEDAGFEIRDCLCWLFGCLSEDTEILVNGRWEPYHKATVGNLALCYNAGDDSYQWSPIQELVTYDYDETAYSIVSEATDQIVSKNHRCLVKQADGRFGFQFAEQAARQPEIQIPVIKNLPALLQEIPLLESVPSSPQSILFSELRREVVDEATQANVTTKNDINQMPAMQNKNMAAECVGTQVQGELLQPVMSGNSCYGRDINGEQIRPNGHEVPGHRTEGRKESRMEGRRNVFSQARQLQADQICPMPGGISRDGAGGRLRYGASASGREDIAASALEVGSSSPQESQPNGQPAAESCFIREQQRPQTIRVAGHTVTNLARITPIHYRGVVWCVRVPTGAFVARRNGKVFVTGNSGFPKSLDVGKAIDKAAGAVREVTKSGSVQRDGNYDGWDTNTSAERPRYDLPATDAAKQWAGWGTALKPSWEPIIVARKPLAGTVAANVQRYGTGAINVDACRIAGEKPDTTRGAGGQNGRYGPLESQGRIIDDGLGRWPANLVHDGSDEVLAVFPESEGMQGVMSADHPSRPGKNTYGEYGQRSVFDSRNDSGSAARFFYCAKASRSDREYGLDGIEIVTISCPAWDAQGQLVKLRVDTEQSPPRVTAVYGASNSDATAWSMWLFGKDFTGQFRTATKSTTGMKTNSTTESKTLNWLLRYHTSESIAVANGEVANGGSHVENANNSTPSLIITNGLTAYPPGVASAALAMPLTISGNAGSPADHPTVKPVELMRWLVRLVTPPGGTVLDMFLGSGSTGRACAMEHFKFIGIEKDAGYFEIARRRIAAAEGTVGLFGMESQPND
jgi:DNA modification methylase